MKERMNKKIQSSEKNQRCGLLSKKGSTEKLNGEDIEQLIMSDSQPQKMSPNMGKQLGPFFESSRSGLLKTNSRAMRA